MTTETQEPVTTIEPILGLGEGYEPTMVYGGQGAVNRLGHIPRGYATVCESAEAVQILYPGATPSPMSLTEALEVARRQRYAGLCILANDGTPTASYPA